MIKPINRFVLAHRPRPVPKGLIYEDAINTCFKLIETKTGNMVGVMTAFPIKSPAFTCYNLNPEEEELHISSLNIYPEHRNMGWGKYLIDFAKNICKKNYHGRLSLMAYNSEKPPHLFYKKQGLVALEDANEAILNDYIRQGITPGYLKAMDMYLPINKREKCEPLDNIDLYEENLFMKFLKWIFKKFPFNTM